MQIYFGKNIEFLRKKFDKTQTDVAFKVQKTQKIVSNWERGKTEPTIGEIGILSTFFGISVDELLFSDLSKGKVIENGGAAKNGEKGKVKGKPKGKVNVKNEEGEDLPTGSKETCKECERKNELIAQKDIIIRAMTSTLKAQEDTISALKLAAKLQEERIPEKQPMRRKAG